MGYWDIDPLKLGYWNICTLKLGYLGYCDLPLHTPLDAFIPITEARETNSFYCL